MTDPGLPRVIVVPADLVPAVAADVIARVLRWAVAERGVAHWATTGGSAAPGIYAGLAALAPEAAVPWDRVQTWWGDDRFVPHDHPLSNVLPIEALGLPARNLHPIPTSEAIALGEGPAWAATRYAADLTAVVPTGGSAAGPATGSVAGSAAGSAAAPASGHGVDPGSAVPVLDLVVLGVGPDGHILSVFPGSDVWDSSALVCPVPAPTHVEPHVERVTMHPRLVAAARAVLVVTAGASKAANLARAWAGDDARDLPVRAARLVTATWVLDEAAAAELPLRGPRPGPDSSGSWLTAGS